MFRQARLQDVASRVRPNRIVFVAGAFEVVPEIRQSFFVRRFLSKLPRIVQSLERFGVGPRAVARCVRRTPGDRNE